MLRLISTKGIKTANDSIKVVLAINLAANLCNTEFDRSMALKLSNVKEKEYTRQKEFFEKLLDLTKKWTLDEICAKLEINEVVKNDADRLLRAYRKSKPLVDDTDNASFLAMALYQSHKLRKIKNPTVKHKLIELSKIKGKTWKNFEEEWDGWIADSSPLADQKKRKGNGGDQFEGNGMPNRCCVLFSIFEINFVSYYRNIQIFRCHGNGFKRHR